MYVHSCERTDVFIPLDLPVPSHLAETFGYEAATPDVPRFIACHLAPGVPVIAMVIADGLNQTLGYWEGFLGFVDHPAVAPALKSYHLGSCDRTATHALVVDRQTHQVTVLPLAAAHDLVCAQWGDLSLPLDATGETQADLHRQTLYRSQLVTAMHAWLDSYQRD
ncbi:MAG: hypothetical protein HC828_18485 [Blastochloris sp.]|nr:hypothetical protein [Blastochloris sp.]